MPSSAIRPTHPGGRHVLVALGVLVVVCTLALARVAVRRHSAASLGPQSIPYAPSDQEVEAAYAKLVLRTLQIPDPVGYAKEWAGRAPHDPRFWIFAGDAAAGDILVEPLPTGPGGLTIEYPLDRSSHPPLAHGPGSAPQPKVLRGDFSQARECYRRAVKAAPGDLLAVLRLAAYSTGAERERLLTRARKIAPDNPLPALALANDLCGRVRRGEVDMSTEEVWALLERVPRGDYVRPRLPWPEGTAARRTMASSHGVDLVAFIPGPFYEYAYPFATNVYGWLLDTAEAAARAGDGGTVKRAVQLANRFVRQEGSVPHRGTVEVDRARTIAKRIAETEQAAMSALGRPEEARAAAGQAALLGEGLDPTEEREMNEAFDRAVATCDSSRLRGACLPSAWASGADPDTVLRDLGLLWVAPGLQGQ